MYLETNTICLFYKPGKLNLLNRIGGYPKIFWGGGGEGKVWYSQVKCTPLSGFSIALMDPLSPLSGLPILMYPFLELTFPGPFNNTYRFIYVF